MNKSILLFVGALVLAVSSAGAGYWYAVGSVSAPEVAKTDEANVVTSAPSTPIVDIRTAKVGDRVGPFAISYLFYERSTLVGEPSYVTEDASVIFSGTTTIAGELYWDDVVGSVITVSNEQKYNLPIIDFGSPIEKENRVGVFNEGPYKTTISLPQDLKAGARYHIVAEINHYQYGYAAKDGGLSANVQVSNILQIQKI